MSGSLVHCFVRVWRVAVCFVFFVLLSPADSWAQGTSILTLLSTDGRELEIDAEVRGALSASDFTTAGESYVEAWALEGRPGQEVSIDLMSDDFDSYLYVVGPGLGEALTDDDSGGACHARINFTVLDRGVFHVVASSTARRQSGTYLLRVSEAPGPVAEMSCGGIDGSALTELPTDGRRLSWSQPVRGHLSVAEATIRDGQPVQAWVLDALAGGSATIRLESDDFDAYLFVFGPGMSEVTSDDDGGEGLNSRLVISFPADGVYRVVASSLGGASGMFTLSVR